MSSLRVQNTFREWPVILAKERMMEKHIPKAETRFDDLAGTASLNFGENFDFKTFAQKVAGVDLEKYEPISLRFFFQKEIMITIFALDKEKYASHKEQTGKVLVKKFKVEVHPIVLVQYIKQADCTLVCGDYDIENFEVIS